MDIEQALQKTLGFGSKEFVEKAVQGGWRDDPNFTYTVRSNGRVEVEFFGLLPFALEEILLDPDSWRAVGLSDEYMLSFIQVLWENE